MTLIQSIMMTRTQIFSDVALEVIITRNYIHRSYDLLQGIVDHRMELVPQSSKEEVECPAFCHDGLLCGHFYYHEGGYLYLARIIIVVLEDWELGPIMRITL